MNKLAIVNKRIRNTVKDIITLSLFVVGSFFVWNMFDYSAEAKMAYAYSNYNSALIVNSVNNANVLLAMNDEDAKDIDGFTVNVINTNSVVKSYKLVLKCNIRETNLDLNYLKVRIENANYNINSLDKYESGNYIYYTLKEADIKKNSTNSYDLKLYLDENFDESVSKNLDFAFDIVEI